MKSAQSKDDSPSSIQSEDVARLYERHLDGLRRLLLGVLKCPDLAEEALQQTFVKVMERGHQADPERRRGWLYQVAYHQALELRRRGAARDRAQQNLRQVLEEEVDSRTPEATASHRETLERVRQAIEDLPEEQRRVLELRIEDARSFDEIADKIGAPLGTVLTRMRLALSKLRQRFGSEASRGDES